VLAEILNRIGRIERETGRRDMKTLKECYVVDENGNRIGVLLDLADYRKLLEELEELESIRAYDSAKASGDEVIPFEQAVDEIEKKPL
jgi:PHD/YefM family antitoxin component YafN of YafNO toxin-antitoxin module